jgi:acyl carrier protein
VLTPAQQQIQETVRRRQRLCREIKEVIVERMNLTIDPDWLTDDQPIFGRGMELDSVDAIEVVVGIEWQFKVSLTDDQMDRFGSINTLADYIEQRQEAA